MKKGFTLIELLAVIVILAIIALIATPIVLNIIAKARENAHLRSGEMYLDAVKMSVANSSLEDNIIPDGTYNILDDGDLCLEYSETTCTKRLEVEVDGDTPKEGTITISNEQITDVSFKYNKKTIVKTEKGKLKYQEVVTLASDIISKYGGESKITTISDFTASSTGLYKIEDDYGTSYYFRGNVENNYVQFGKWGESKVKYMADGPSPEYYDTLEACEAGNNHITYDTECIKMGEDIGDLMYWRILRINGDGTLRIIYDGTSKVQNGVSHKASIANGYFYENYSDEKQIGYTYDNGSGTQVDSAIKKVIDDWYTKNLKKSYENYIADSLFCNDRKEYSTTYPSYSSIDGTYKYITYSSANRISQKTPSLLCSNKTDRYTVKNTTLGNGLLSNPIGLITADEEYLAGVGNSLTYYLYGVGNYWTMTPNNFSYYDGADGGINEGINIYYVSDSGMLSGGYLYNSGLDSKEIGIRPVINLKADVEFTGSGKIDDPYIIVTK